MAVTASQAVAVGTSAVLLSAAESDGVTGQSLLLTNKGSVELVLGPSSVSAGAGYRVAAGATVPVDLGVGEALHGVVASGSTTVDVLRTGA